MNDNLYVYVLEVFAYSDFEYYLLFHEKKISKDEFFRMIEWAKYQLKKDRWHNKGYFPQNVIHLLKEEYGFVEKDTPIAYIGGNVNNKTEVE